MFKIRLVAKPELYIARKDISYAIKSDQEAQRAIDYYKSRNNISTDDQVFQYNAHWYVPEERAYVFASIKNMLNVLRGICKKGETYSRYEVVLYEVTFANNITLSLDNFLKLHRK